jgi:hypothetical protein
VALKITPPENFEAPVLRGGNRFSSHYFCVQQSK